MLVRRHPPTFAVSGRLPDAVGAEPTHVLPSQDDSQLPARQNPPTFAISRGRALAGGEVQPPLWLEGPANPISSTFHQRIPYALERPQGLPIDAF